MVIVEVKLEDGCNLLLNYVLVGGDVHEVEKGSHSGEASHEILEQRAVFQTSTKPFDVCIDTNDHFCFRWNIRVCANVLDCCFPDVICRCSAASFTLLYESVLELSLLSVSGFDKQRVRTDEILVAVDQQQYIGFNSLPRLVRNTWYKGLIRRTMRSLSC